MIKEGTTPKVIYVQENMSQQTYGINQDGLIPGMVKYYREDILDGYMRMRKIFSLAYMDFLERNRIEGKMCLSSAECYDISKAFDENDFAKPERYFYKYTQPDKAILK